MRRITRHISRRMHKETVEINRARNFTKLYTNARPRENADSFISNRYNAEAPTLLRAINYNVTPLLSDELRYRATIVQSITRILDLLTFRSHTPYTYVYQNIWKKNSLTTDSPFSISRQRATGTVESAKQTKRKRSFIDHTALHCSAPPRICRSSRSPAISHLPLPLSFSFSFSFFLFLPHILFSSLFLKLTERRNAQPTDRSGAERAAEGGSDNGLSLGVTV